MAVQYSVLWFCVTSLFSSDGCFGSFQMCMNNAQASILVHEACASIWVLPRGRLRGAELLGERGQQLLCLWIPMDPSHSHQQYKDVPILLHTCQLCFFLFLFFNLCHFDGEEQRSPVA